jgi:predicted TIM-barrel fold metal-dependent hydrolase
MVLNGWIDIHSHFYPPETSAQREARRVAMNEAGWNVSQPFVWDPDATLEYMDRTGIAMQMLSNIPKTFGALQASNDYAASLVRKRPNRFGLLAALPTDSPDEALAEIARANRELAADGFAVTCHYNGVYLSDARLDPVWQELDRRRAVVFAHPDAYAPAAMGRPVALAEVAFETARTVIDMLYAGTFRKFPNVKFVLAHCGGALPALSGRLMILGNESWVPNPNGVTLAEFREHLNRLYLDTAATSPTTLGPALAMTTHDHLVYGSDCGVPCTTERTMRANLEALLSYAGLTQEQIEGIGHNALRLFPAAAERIKTGSQLKGATARN